MLEAKAEEMRQQEAWMAHRLYRVDDSHENELFTAVNDADADDNCPICMEPLTPEHGHVVRLPCGHRFHDEYIRRWLQGQLRPSCAMCRRPYRIEWTGENAYPPAPPNDGPPMEEDVNFFVLANVFRRDPRRGPNPEQQGGPNEPDEEVNAAEEDFWNFARGYRPGPWEINNAPEEREEARVDAADLLNPLNPLEEDDDEEEDFFAAARNYHSHSR